MESVMLAMFCNVFCGDTCIELLMHLKTEEKTVTPGPSGSGAISLFHLDDNGRILRHYPPDPGQAFIQAVGQNINLFIEVSCQFIKIFDQLPDVLCDRLHLPVCIINQRTGIGESTFQAIKYTIDTVIELADKLPRFFGCLYPDYLQDGRFRPWFSRYFRPYRQNQFSPGSGTTS